MDDRYGEGGLIVFDGSCGVCSSFVGDRASFFERYGFRVVPLQERWAQEAMGLDERTLSEAIHLRLPNGRVVRGIDFFLEVARRVWWLKPFGFAFGIPIVKPIAARVYAAVAKRRRSISSLCGLQSRARYK